MRRRPFLLPVVSRAGAASLAGAASRTGAVPLAGAASRTGAVSLAGAAFRVAWVLLAIMMWAGSVRAQDEAPPGLAALLEAKPGAEFAVEFGERKRREAMRAAALAYGARGGLARRSWEIAGVVEKHAASLDRLYGFRRLMESRHGFVLVPPVVGETRRAIRLARDGRRAASASRVMRIMAPERLATAPPHWRDYLTRRWRVPEPPVAVLFPRDEGEEADWARWVGDGWREGVRQADAIFAADLDRLNALLEGMARWSRLHDQRMVGAPTVQVSRSATTGDGRVLRVGETLVRLGPPAALEPRSRLWRGFVFRAAAAVGLPVWPEAGP